MAKKRRSRSRSTSPHTNAPTQHAPARIMQRASKVVANAATTAARQLMSSGSKAMQRNKSQGLDATVQQGDASTTVNAQGANASNNSNSGVNATQEHGAMDPNASLLSDLESQAPRFVTNATSRSSPSNSSQTTTPTSGAMTTPTSGATPPTSQAPASTPSATPLVAETLSSKHWDNTSPGACFWSGCLSLWGIELVKDRQRIEQDLRTHPHCLVGKEYCKEITMCFWLVFSLAVDDLLSSNNALIYVPSDLK